jgi:hypothetical protein
MPAFSAPGEAVRVEIAPSNRLAAAVRAHLASHFLYRSWYPSVHEIEVRGKTAFVSTWRLHRGDGRAAPLAICKAVLSSHRVKEARVSAEGGFAVGCP